MTPSTPCANQTHHASGGGPATSVVTLLHSVHHRPGITLRIKFKEQTRTAKGLPARPPPHPTGCAPAPLSGRLSPYTTRLPLSLRKLPIAGPLLLQLCARCHASHRPLPRTPPNPAPCLRQLPSSAWFFLTASPRGPVSVPRDGTLHMQGLCVIHVCILIAKPPCGTENTQ